MDIARSAIVNTPRTAKMLASVAATALVMTACTSDDAGTTADAPPTTSVATAGWRDEVAARCAGAGDEVAAMVEAVEENDGTPAGIAGEATAIKAIFDLPGGFESIAVPADVQPTLDRVVAWRDEARRYLADSIESAHAGDTEAATRALDEGSDRFTRTTTAWAIAGAPCLHADPARVQNGDLAVPLEMHSEHATAGFDSIWVSEHLANRVVRLDPDTGDVQATIDVGDKPFRLQPADGSMWVRTASSYVAIDPATDTVTATLAKADVGPAANRSWAVDGAMWICDGRRLHRYDPTSLVAIATLDLELECGAVWADDDLVVAWSYNEHAGESGTSAAAFVDPATNTVLATVPLPVDVGGPVVLPDAVFFPGYGGSTAVIVDRATWTVSATPDLGVAGGGEGQPAFDGESIYVSTADHRDVLRVDGSTFTVTDTIQPLGVNAVLVDGGSLWIARGQPYDVVQRFDIDEGQ
jgi:hypothetical protein